ncbi:MAG: hypothetical protein K0R29_378 [Pseudobdellovibrio sp.]|jgi:hypothetical protein|nr:hypothetical protein [Pseudobdellovibrio sp.]
MKKIIFATLLLALNAMAVCPDTSINESATDCPWAEMARQISVEKKSCDDVFKTVPQLATQLKLDSESHDFLNLWGHAKNFDESAKGVIVPSEVLQCLAAKLKIKNAVQELPNFSVVHAGLQHTYAYMFSNLVTKYGFKRDRWTKDDLREGLGLTPGLLSPQAGEGAFLSNVTYLFAKLTFGTQGLKPKKNVAKEILNLDTAKFQIRHLREFVPEKNIAVHTHFVKLDTTKLTSKNTHLLIYWIEDIKAKKNFFISGFPVDTATVDRAFDPSSLGTSKVISTRYNAWWPGMTDSASPLTGNREEIK